MNLLTVMSMLPDTDKGVVVVLSGGMDSTITMRLCVEKYGSDKVYALSFDYGQKQKIELEKARESTSALGVSHKVLDLGILGDISQGFSANVDASIDVPTIHEVLGDPQPKTYVPNRNMILMSLAASFAEVNEAEYVFMGLQVHDEYSYWDVTQRFVDKINSALAENRTATINIVAPFSTLSKLDEINLLKELDGNINLLAMTLTCYNPNEYGASCGVCPSCSERIAAMNKAGEVDPITYASNKPSCHQNV